MLIFHHFYQRKVNNKLKIVFSWILKNIKAIKVLVFIINNLKVLILKNQNNLIFMIIKRNNNNKLLFLVKLSSITIKTF